MVLIKKIFNWQTGMAAVLLLFSAAIYYIHFRIFGNYIQTINYMVGSIAFLPFEALIVTLILQRLLTYREKRARFEKLNMVIGSFFSEAGGWLLAYLSDLDPGLDKIKEKFHVRADWTQKDFARLSRELQLFKFTIDPAKLDTLRLKGYVASKRDFLLRLLENPNLLEHETFTELLLAYFHLIEELGSRVVISPLGANDLKHVAGDAQRVYALLVRQWVTYMEHLAKYYPYLFSLAIRTNPFDENASVEIS